MTTPDHPGAGRPSPPPKEAPASLELRARPRRVTRLNPRILATIAGGLATAVLGALLWSLQPQQRRQGSSPNELYNVERIARAEALGQLPADYAQLVPPPPAEVPSPDDSDETLPKAEPPLADPRDPPAGHDLGDAALHARLEEAEAAALSPVFFRSVGRAGANGSKPGQTQRAQVEPGTLYPGPASIDATPGNATASTARPGSNEAVFSKNADTQIRNAGSVQMPESPYQVMAGTVIAAALVTGIKSDLPGDVIATVTEPVYDSATGRHLLIPQGSRLLGRYNSQVGYGQRRVQVVWQRVILPDASSFQLDNLVGTDAAGYAGLEDGVDWHWDRLVAGAAMTTLLGIGAELGAPSSRGEGDRIIIAGRDSLQETVNQVGQEVTRRNLDIRPTLTQRPGLPLRVIVNRDLVLRPFH